jgi:2-polyprenyl-3-methyl-5-hydroxy-6-metoxy-1,4-benzoquinol methylase
MNGQSDRNDAPWTRPWPEEGLERLGRCPVCGSSERELLHEALKDEVFFCAPGYWTMWRCAGCRCGYLDPRPTVATIGQAYGNYYTHQAAGSRTDSSSLSLLRRIRRVLSNGYLNARYGTNYQPASRLGPGLAKMLPRQREALDVQFRWLPKPVAGQRVLDVGCGNGAFLLKAREAGWQVMGVDPDPDAVATARQKGLEVRLGSVEAFAGEAGLFDAITFSHVIEHAHDPKSVLADAYRLLKPGGKLYLDTPNIDSRGSRIFGRHWRGIETPRHLVLFSLSGLQQLLQQCGFSVIELQRRRNMDKGMFLSSFRIARGLSPYGNQPKSLPVGLALRAHLPFVSTSQLEFITLLTHKK